MTSASDPDSSCAYTFDNIGRVLTVSNSGTSGASTVVLTSAYNANHKSGGNWTEVATSTFAYDTLDRLTTSTGLRTSRTMTSRTTRWTG